MSLDRPQPSRRLSRFVHLHYKLLICLALGAAVVLLTPQDWAPVIRLVLGWDIALVLYLLAIYVFVAGAKVEAIQRRAALQDEGAFVILLLTAIATFASLAALVLLLGHDKAGDAWVGWKIALTMTTIVLSWLFVHTMFALHYAHEYYGDRRSDISGDYRGGLKFPGHTEPDYWDFLYFSLVIAMTSQVSDVAITSKAIRRMASLHGALSFFFNLGILALTVNMLASAIS
jgi:uncharacterized membrane protein